MKLMIKVCGMVYPENILAVAGLNPDMIGFIFYTGSIRYAGLNTDVSAMQMLPAEISKTGVFVNQGIEEISETISAFGLDFVQLHGKESPEICSRIKESGIGVIKSFAIDIRESFKPCYRYLTCTDYFLFDTVTKDYGGSGQSFDWEILEGYEFGHPFILSGGISPSDTARIARIANPAFAGIDLNSRFEIAPGIKNTVALGKFIEDIRSKPDSYERYIYS